MGRWPVEQRQAEGNPKRDKADGVPDDVNLLDVLEHVADCVMAGMARSGSVYELKLSDELLQKAFKNTVKLLCDQTMLVG